MVPNDLNMFILDIFKNVMKKYLFSQAVTLTDLYSIVLQV
jgi:hypothetical protein